MKPNWKKYLRFGDTGGRQDTGRRFSCEVVYLEMTGPLWAIGGRK